MIQVCIELILLDCKSLGMAKGPDGKCSKLLSYVNLTHWLVLSKDDPTMETGVYKENDCNYNIRRKIKVNGTCRSIGTFDGCGGGPPMTLFVNLYGDPICQCHCENNATLCSQEDVRVITDKCLDFYQQYICRWCALTADFPAFTICPRGEVMARNDRCYNEDPRVETTVAEPRYLANYAQYIINVTRLDFAELKEKKEIN